MPEPVSCTVPSGLTRRTSHRRDEVRVSPQCRQSQLHAHSSDGIAGNFYAAIKSAQERKKSGDKEAKYPKRRSYQYQSKVSGEFRFPRSWGFNGVPYWSKVSSSSPV